MTGELQDLQSQISWLSGEINQIQQSLGTEWIVMQVKSDLAWEYQEIVWYTTSQVNHYQDTFWTLLWIAISLFVIILGFVWYLAKIYIDNILNQVAKIWKDIELNKEVVDQQFKSMCDTQNQLDEQIDTVKLIEENIESQDERIYKNVIQTTTNYWFDRIKENPEDRTNLEKNILVLDPNFVRSRDNNYNYTILKNINDDFPDVRIVLYQFFPDYLFMEGMIALWVWQIKIGWMSNYISEITYSTKLIFDIYKKEIIEKQNLKNELKTYLSNIYHYLVCEDKRGYWTIKCIEIEQFIDHEVKNIKEEKMRQDIKQDIKEIIALEKTQIIS